MQNGMKRYSYQCQKLNEARRWLMAPHHQSEADYYAGSYGAFWIGIQNLGEKRLEDNPDAESAIQWIDRINEIFTMSAGEDSIQRARKLTDKEKSDYSNCIDELANWFSGELHPPK